MGLQYYDINVGLNKTQQVSAQGRYIYYLSGSTPLIEGAATPGAGEGNQAIKIRPGQNGQEIILMPGQSLRLPANSKSPDSWKISNYKNAEVITGLVMIGEGEFQDSNTQNTFKLDGAFANNVTVNNSAASPIPVSMKEAAILTYNFSKTIGNMSVGANVLIAPAENVNGVIIERLFCNVTGPVFMAHTAAPVSLATGDHLLTPGYPEAAGAAIQRIRIAAGKGVYLYYFQGVDANSRASLLATIL